jgi:Fe-S-cluster containining protein
LYQFLNAAEANDIAGYLKINKFDFFKKYTEERETPDGVTTSLKSKKNVPECVFLSDKKCTIYEVRPTQCRTYPWWPSTLIGEAEWKAEAMRCEGIVLDAVGPAVETDYLDERLVPTKDILHNLVLHQVHGRGMGIEMNYKDASDSLIESENQSPGLIEEFEQDFFSTHFSRVLYEDDVVRVIETTIPAPDDDTGYTDPSHPHNTGIAKLNGGTTSTAAAVSLSSSASSPAAASGVHSTAEVNHIHMDEAIHHMQEESRSPSEQMKLQTFRRLEFNGSPHMTQTEVKMSVSSRRRKDDDAIRKVDYSQLLMPVHQVLAKLIKLELKSERPQLGGDHRPPSNSFLEVLGGAVSKVSPRTKKQHWWRFVVLGAGGCALPMHILQDKSVDPAFRITIDAVEPLDQVLYCAEMYFGAVWGNSGNEDTVRVLRPHNNNAFDYFRESSFSNYDIVVLDAFEDFTVERPAQQTAANSPISPNIVSDTTTLPTSSSSGRVNGGNTEPSQTRCSATEVQLRTRYGNRP